MIDRAISGRLSPKDAAARIASSPVNDQNGDEITVGNYKINIAEITNEDLILMRKLLPKDEYTVLKNRKSARLCRLLKKEQLDEIQKNSEDLQRANEALREELTRAYAELAML